MLPAQWRGADGVSDGGDVVTQSVTDGATIVTQSVTDGATVVTQRPRAHTQTHATSRPERERERERGGGKGANGGGARASRTPHTRCAQPACKCVISPHLRHISLHLHASMQDSSERRSDAAVPCMHSWSAYRRAPDRSQGLVEGVCRRRRPRRRGSTCRRPRSRLGATGTCAPSRQPQLVRQV